MRGLKSMELNGNVPMVTIGYRQGVFGFLTSDFMRIKLKIVTHQAPLWRYSSGW